MAKENEMKNASASSMSDADMSRGTVEALARNAVAREAERNLSTLNVNTDAALYRTADEMHLSDMKTDEIRFTFGGKGYIAQGFTEGILYVEDGMWDQIRRIDWGTTKDAAEGGKTEGAAIGQERASVEGSLTPGGEAAGEGRGAKGSGLTEI